MLTMRLLRNNGLSIALFGLFFITLGFGQLLTGQRESNRERGEEGLPRQSLGEYLKTPHFLEATMENWESEFLQMGVYVALTAFLFQKGSAESKDPMRPSPVDRDPRASRRKKSAPWPVRRGGWVLRLYECSLSLAFLVLFLICFGLHALGGMGEFNEDLQLHGHPPVTYLQYLQSSRFWFESFQNWQSEFLAIFCMVVFTIFLRQRGSPESKPVDMPHSETAD
jgi:hypothetical protein